MFNREVRRVTPDWKHPKDTSRQDGFKPLYHSDWYDASPYMNIITVDELQDIIEMHGPAPDLRDYMPNWKDTDATHYMMYETTSIGTPISPAFDTPQRLATWLYSTHASYMGDLIATYDLWLSVINSESDLMRFDIK